MVEDVKPHQLYKQVAGTDFTALGEGGSLPLVGVNATNGWMAQIVAAAGGIVSYSFRNYIDLAGWTKEELTTFIQGVDIQKSRPPGFASNVSEIVEIDLLTTRRLTDSEVGVNFLARTMPGFLGDTLEQPAVDLMNVIYGQQRTYTPPNPATGAFITTNTSTWGSGVPTAMDKLHWTRIYLISVTADATGVIYPTNLVVQAMTTKEKDLVWMERLRRSYVLQDEADV